MRLRVGLSISFFALGCTSVVETNPQPGSGGSGGSAVSTGPGAGGSSGGDRVSAILMLDGDPTDGERAFSSSCGLGGPCHQADGTSGTGSARDLTVATSSLSDSAIVTQILEGGGAMPPQDTLDDQDVADILAYMRSAWGG